MPVFTFVVDEKITIWQRQKVDVEASTLDEAIRTVSEDTAGEGIVSTEFLLETFSAIAPSDNEGYETRVILHEDVTADGFPRPLWSNGISSIATKA